MSTINLTCAQTHTSRCAPFIALPGELPLLTHTSSCLLEIWLMMTHIHTHTHAWLLTQTHISPSRYRSVFLARMRHYMHLAYLFHQCATSLLSRDGHIADCTVRHPVVERPLFSLFFICWCSKIAAMMLYYQSTVPCTCIDDTSANAIFVFRVF